MSCSPVLSGDCTKVFVKTASEELWAIAVSGTNLTTTTLTVLWRCTYSASGVAQACATTATPGVDAPLAALGHGTQAVQAPTATSAPVVPSSPALVPGDTSLVVSMSQSLEAGDGSGDVTTGGGLYMVSTDTGKVAWRLTQYDGIAFGYSHSSPAIATDGGTVQAW